MKNKKATDIRVCNKELYDVLPFKQNSYKPAVDLAFLAGLFDGDGHIHSYPSGMKWIFTQSKYTHLVQQVVDIAGKYGKITAKLVQRKNNDGQPVFKVYVLKDARNALAKSEFADYCIKYKLMVGRAGLS